MLKFDWNILWTIINLVVFFLLMRFFLFKPIKKVIDERQELIDKRFIDADDAKNAAEKLKAEYTTQLEGVEAEKKVIIARAQESAKEEYDKVIDRAREDADRVRADARRSAELETEKARLAVKEEIAKLAMETAEKVVGKSACALTDSDLYDKFLNEGSEN